jgi:hypothetical protein
MGLVHPAQVWRLAPDGVGNSEVATSHPTARHEREDAVEGAASGASERAPSGYFVNPWAVANQQDATAATAIGRDEAFA